MHRTPTLGQAFYQTHTHTKICHESVSTARDQEQRQKITRDGLFQAGRLCLGTSGTSLALLGQKVLAIFSFVLQAISQFNRSVGIYVEVPDILLPDADANLLSVSAPTSCCVNSSASPLGRLS